MPPLPTTFDEPARQLVESLQRRHHDLSEFQIPRLRACKSSLAEQQQLAAELREDLDTFARQVETLAVSVDDQRGERNRRELGGIVDGLREDLAKLRQDSRAALLVSKRAIDTNQLSNREELLRSSAIHEKQDLNEKVTEDALMKANYNVTEALQRTLGLMQGELERSVLSTQLLDASTASLRSASTTHDILDGLLVTSKHLITALEKSDWMDRLLILAGLVFFLLVVLFILKQRLVDRGLRVALWWTRFLPDFSSDEVLLKMESGQELVQSITAAAASVIVTASSIAQAITTIDATSHTSFESSTPTVTESIETSIVELHRLYSSDLPCVSGMSDCLPSLSSDSSTAATSPASLAHLDLGFHDDL